MGKCGSLQTILRSVSQQRQVPVAYISHDNDSIFLSFPAASLLLVGDMSHRNTLPLVSDSVFRNTTKIPMLNVEPLDIKNDSYKLIDNVGIIELILYKCIFYTYISICK